MREVYEALHKLTGPAALATVVRVEGSAYRREGAKMLIPAEGLPVGMLSGGCLEDDVRELAKATLSDGRPQLVSYDMRSDDDSLWGLNMGCNGLIDVFIELVGPELHALADEYCAGRACSAYLGVAEGESRGQRRVLFADGSSVGTLAVSGTAPLRPGLSEDGVYAEPVDPAPVLWVVGAGADAPPLVRAAAAAGWRVRVVDRRSKYADPARFLEAEEVLHIEPAEFAARAGVGAYVVFMHHNFDHDRDYVTSMLEGGARYLGVLGPLRRTLKMLDREDLPANVYAPVGLDLGGEGPEAVAVSIVAELQAVRHGRGGGHLRGSDAPILR